MQIRSNTLKAMKEGKYKLPAGSNVNHLDESLISIREENNNLPSGRASSGIQ